MPKKPFTDRTLKNETRSARWRAGSRRNKRLKSVPTFGSDRGRR